MRGGGLGGFLAFFVCKNYSATVLEGPHKPFCGGGSLYFYYATRCQALEMKFKSIRLPGLVTRYDFKRESVFLGGQFHFYRYNAIPAITNFLTNGGGKEKNVAP